MAGRPKKRKLTKNPKFIVGLLVLVVVVNWPLLSGLLGGGEPGSTEGGDGAGDAWSPLAFLDGVGGGGADPALAAPLVEFLPVGLEEVVVDPFLHRVVDDGLPGTPTAKATTRDIAVSLVLVTGRGRCAVIDGRVLRAGDTCAVGVIDEVLGDGVRVTLPAGGTRFFRVGAGVQRPDPEGEGEGGAAGPVRVSPSGRELLPLEARQAERLTEELVDLGKQLKVTQEGRR